MLLADQELLLPSREDLRDGDPPPLQAERARRWPISLGTLASLSLHIALVVALTLLLEQDFLSNNVTTLPSFDVTLVTASDDVQVASQAPAESAAIAGRQTQESVEEAAVENSSVIETTEPPLNIQEPAAAPPKELAETLPQASEPKLEPEPVIATQQHSEWTVAEAEQYAPPSAAGPAMIEDALRQREMAPRPQLALTAEQQTMLAERIQTWQDDLAGLVAKQDSVTWEKQGQTYTATVSKIMPESAMELERAVVKISTSVDGKTMATEMQMKRLAFSNYGQFVDRWDDDVTLYNDEIEGRFHSNTTIKVQSGRGVQPRFLGRVTTARTAEYEGRTRRDEIFLGGLETRVKRVYLPDDIAPVFYPSAENFQERTETDNYHYIDGDADIVFYANGEYSWLSEDGAVAQRRRIGDDAFYIMASDGSELSVRGVVKGKVVVYSPDVVSIAGNLRYAQDPEVNPASNDYLALISEKYVEVAGPDVTGPGDLTVYAAIYAKRRFSITRFRNNNQGLLTIYGSLSAGSLSASEPRYATSIRFDKRFENQRPPGYPMTERYELEQWDQRWQEVN